MRLALLFGCAQQAHCERLVLQLGSARQAQFAGYYVAQAKGYYAAAGLDVIVRPGPAQGDSQLPQPGADVWSAWLLSALAARAHGVPLVNVAQIFAHSGLELICRKTSRIYAPYDLKGHTVGVWQDGTQIPFTAWMKKLGFHIPADVQVAPLARVGGAADVAPLLRRDVSCLTGLAYDEYWQTIAAGIAAPDLQVFHFGDAGLAPLQDGLYATEATLADPARRATLARFLKASLKGWKYALLHQSEAVRLVLAAQPASDAETLRQTRMMSTVARLIEPGLHGLGYLEPAAYERTVDMLMQPPDGPIKIWPAGAWTHAIWNQANR